MLGVLLSFISLSFISFLMKWKEEWWSLNYIAKHFLASMWGTFILVMQAVSYIRTLYAFTNETLAKYSYATSLQATLRYGILISLVQGLGLGFTYGLAICSCALQLWVGRFLVMHNKAHGGEIITALFAVILSGLWESFSTFKFFLFRLPLYLL